MQRILLIDDDARMGEPLAAYCRRFDFELQQATRPSEGLALLRQGGFDAVVLDVMLPEQDGFAVCRAIRAESDVPVVMLTARGDVTDRVVGLELGTDDYLPKPFDPRELVARITTVLRRRRTAAPDARLRFDGLVIDPVTRSVERQGAPVELTGTEFELLLLLAREPGRVFSRDDILNQLRGHEAELVTRAVDIVVSRLRRKLEPLPAIKTLRNSGYALALRPHGHG
jgi:two-component system, OmpR family, response regulator